MGTMSRTALVTGASSGFGRLISLSLASRGYRVFGAFRGSREGFEKESQVLADHANSRDVNVESVQMDVRDDESVLRAVSEVLGRAQSIDALVNCAGYGLLGPFESTSIEQMRQLYETNVFGTMRVVSAVIPSMRDAGSGTILNFGSDVGVRANFFQTAYASSKFAVEGFTQALRLELRQFGIQVAMISPGWYDTEFGDSVELTFGVGVAASAYEGLVTARNRGVDRVEGPSSSPQEVADLVVHVLESDEPAFRYVAGWNAVRMAGVIPDEIDTYQQRLFEYYQLEAFMRPQPESPPRDGA